MPKRYVVVIVNRGVGIDYGIRKMTFVQQFLQKLQLVIVKHALFPPVLFGKMLKNFLCDHCNYSTYTHIFKQKIKGYRSFVL